MVNEFLGGGFNELRGWCDVPSWKMRGRRVPFHRLSHDYSTSQHIILKRRGGKRRTQHAFCTSAGCSSAGSSSAEDEEGMAVPDHGQQTADQNQVVEWLLRGLLDPSRVNVFLACGHCIESFLVDIVLKRYRLSLDALHIPHMPVFRMGAGNVGVVGAGGNSSGGNNAPRSGHGGGSPFGGGSPLQTNAVGTNFSKVSPLPNLGNGAPAAPPRSFGGPASQNDEGIFRTPCLRTDVLEEDFSSPGSSYCGLLLKQLPLSAAGGPGQLSTMESLFSSGFGATADDSILPDRTGFGGGFFYPESARSSEAERSPFLDAADNAQRPQSFMSGMVVCQSSVGGGSDGGGGRTGASAAAKDGGNMMADTSPDGPARPRSGGFCRSISERSQDNSQDNQSAHVGGHGLPSRHRIGKHSSSAPGSAGMGGDMGGGGVGVAVVGGGRSCRSRSAAPKTDEGMFALLFQGEDAITQVLLENFSLEEDMCTNFSEQDHSNCP